MSHLHRLAFCLFLTMIPAKAAENSFVDAREPLIVTPQEKAYILGQMRLFVASVQITAEGLANSRSADIIEAASARGAKRNANDPEFPSSLNAKLPATWKGFGNGMRKDFDALAEGVQKGDETKATLAILSKLMTNCVACHASYRLQDTAP